MSYVYFISDNHGHIKIGKANDVESRLKELQTGNPYKLSTLLIVPVTSDNVAFDMECTIHRHFKNYQMEGEWFRATPVLQVINTDIVTIKNYRFNGLLAKTQKGNAYIAYEIKYES